MFRHVKLDASQRRRAELMCDALAENDDLSRIVVYELVWLRDELTRISRTPQENVEAK
jgi:hypothetical protein